MWGQQGHGQRAVLPFGEQRQMRLDIRTDQTLPAFTRGSLDGNPGATPAQGDPEGQSNLYLYWETSDIVDDRRRWELTVGLTDSAPADRCTVDVTPRRTQRFRPRPGERVAWRNISRKTGAAIQQGTATADKWGLVTIEQAIVSRSKNRLEVELLGTSTDR